jgi:hypothetical protein
MRFLHNLHQDRLINQTIFLAPQQNTRGKNSLVGLISQKAFLWI